MTDIPSFSDWENTIAQAAQVRGRHYSEWNPTLDELKRARKYDEYLSLLLECISATELESCEWQIALGKPYPTPSRYTLEAAQLYRRQGRLNQEVGILERYVNVPGNRGASPMVKKKLDSALRHRERMQAAAATTVAEPSPA